MKVLKGAWASEYLRDRRNWAFSKKHQEKLQEAGEFHEIR